MARHQSDVTIRVLAARLPPVVDALMGFARGAAIVLVVIGAGCVILLGAKDVWQWFNPVPSDPVAMHADTGVKLNLVVSKEAPAPAPSPEKPVAPSPAVTMLPPVEPILNQPAFLERSRDIDTALKQLRCGWAKVRTTGRSGVLEGVVAIETVADLLLARNDMPVPRPPDVKLQLFSTEPTYCQALELVQRIQRQARPALAKFSARLRLPPGATGLPDGDPIIFDVTPPDVPGYLRVDLLTRTPEAGTVGRATIMHLIPRNDPAHPGLNHRSIFRGGPADSDFIVPEGGKPAFDGWEVALPADTKTGADLYILTWASPPDLPIDISSPDEEDAEGYLKRLGDAFFRAGPFNATITAVLVPMKAKPR